MACHISSSAWVQSVTLVLREVEATVRNFVRSTVASRKKGRLDCFPCATERGEKGAYGIEVMGKRNRSWNPRGWCPVYDPAS